MPEIRRLYLRVPVAGRVHIVTYRESLQTLCGERAPGDRYPMVSTCVVPTDEPRMCVACADAWWRTERAKLLDSTGEQA